MLTVTVEERVSEHKAELFFSTSLLCFHNV